MIPEKIIIINEKIEFKLKFKSEKIHSLAFNEGMKDPTKAKEDTNARSIARWRVAYVKMQNDFNQRYLWRLKFENEMFFMKM